MDVYEQKSASNLDTFYHMASSGKIAVISIQTGIVHGPIFCLLATRCLCGKCVGLH